MTGSKGVRIFEVGEVGVNVAVRGDGNGAACIRGKDGRGEWKEAGVRAKLVGTSSLCIGA